MRGLAFFFILLTDETTTDYQSKSQEMLSAGYSYPFYDMSIIIILLKDILPCCSIRLQNEGEDKVLHRKRVF